MAYTFNISFLICALALAPCLVSGQATEIEVLENGAQITVPDSVKRGAAEDGNRLKQNLLTWYAATGYLNAEITSIQHDSLQNEEQIQKITRVHVLKGCRFTLSELITRFTGHFDSTQVKRSLGNYSQEMLEREIGQSLFLLEERGYAFAKSSVTEFVPDVDKCSVRVQILIDTGERISASEIYFLGARVNSQAFLQRISRFKSGTLLTPIYLRQLRANLNNSELFSSVEAPQIFMQDSGSVVIYRVQERSLNKFDGLIGYAPDKEGKGQIAGSAALSLWNVLAQGNGINFRYQRLRPERTKLNMGVTQLWMGSLPIGISADFQLEQRDTTFQARDARLAAFYLFESGLRLTGGLEYVATTTGRNLPKVVEPDGRKQIARLGFEYSTLNNYDTPTSGHTISLTFGVANKDLKLDSAAAFIQNMLHFDMQNYFPIFKRSVIATSLHGFFLDAEKVTLYDMQTFGGTNSLRGYAEDQFYAGTMLWGDVEYRFMLNRFSYLFGFAAAGGYERPRLVIEPDNAFVVVDYLYSGGIGLSYRTAIGQISFTYAVSPQESIGNGKIHFGIITTL